MRAHLQVSAHKEKVWYYDRRKWEGKALSTRLASDGGCCIWYDEPSLLRGVQKRLGMGIERLDAFLERQPGGISRLTAAYGQARDGGLNELSTLHLAQLAPAVAELAQIEVRAQQAFLLGIHRPLGGVPLSPEVLPQPAVPPAVTSSPASLKGQAEGRAERGNGGRGGGGGGTVEGGSGRARPRGKGRGRGGR